MNGAKRPVVLTEYASLRLTPDEDKQIAEAAERQGLTRSPMATADGSSGALVSA
jgi:uncharacterized protein (DUF1778 family)